MDKYGVFITMMNEDKFAHNYLEAADMVGVARILITFKPKRGYEVVKVEIGEAEQLEMELFEKTRWED